MSRKRLWIAAAIIAIILIAGFALSVPHTTDVIYEPTKTESENTPSITIRDAFKKGVHTITGTIEVPNACTIIAASASVIEGASSTEGILLSVSMIKDDGVCLQLPIKEKFSTTISAPANLPISATVNGIETITTVL